MKITLANQIAPDGTPRFAASHLGLFFGLPMSYKKDTRLIWVKVFADGMGTQLSIRLGRTPMENLVFFLAVLKVAVFRLVPGRASWPYSWSDYWLHFESNLIAKTRLIYLVHDVLFCSGLVGFVESCLICMCRGLRLVVSSVIKVM